jgi:hypothetical protein
MGADAFITITMQFNIYTDGVMKTSGPLESRETLIDEYLLSMPDKMKALHFLSDYIESHNYKTVCSLGSGTCAFESLLFNKSGALVVAALDSNKFFINQAKRAFPEIDADCFDFYTDAFFGCYDICYFLGSSYVMTDKQYTDLLKRIRKAGVRTVIDFCAAFVQTNRIPISLLGGAKQTLFKSNLGKWHGYKKTKGSLRGCYKGAGWNIEKELIVDPYKYVAVLKR